MAIRSDILVYQATNAAAEAFGSRFVGYSSLIRLWKGGPLLAKKPDLPKTRRLVEYLKSKLD